MWPWPSGQRVTPHWTLPHCFLHCWNLVYGFWYTLVKQVCFRIICTKLYETNYRLDAVCNFFVSNFLGLHNPSWFTIILSREKRFGWKILKITHSGTNLNLPLLSPGSPSTRNIQGKWGQFDMPVRVLGTLRLFRSMKQGKHIIIVSKKNSTRLSFLGIWCHLINQKRHSTWLPDGLRTSLSTGTALPRKRWNCVPEIRDMYNPHSCSTSLVINCLYCRTSPHCFIH